MLGLDARYEWQAMGPKTHHKSLSDKPFVRIEQLLYYRRHSLCHLELHERSDWTAMAPDTHWSLSDTTFCAYTEARTYIAIWCVTMHEPTTGHFITTMLATYTTHCSVFSVHHVH